MGPGTCIRVICAYVGKWKSIYKVIPSGALESNASMSTPLPVPVKGRDAAIW